MLCWSLSGLLFRLKMLLAKSDGFSTSFWEAPLARSLAARAFRFRKAISSTLFICSVLSAAIDACPLVAWTTSFSSCSRCCSPMARARSRQLLEGETKAGLERLLLSITGSSVECGLLSRLCLRKPS